MMIVTIDPGHGGEVKEGGSSPNNATGPAGTLEKTVTLDLGLGLRDLLMAQGHQVFMTRDADVNLGLADRAAVARESGSDVFLSIHLNGFHDPTVQGTESWLHRNHSAGSALFAHAIHTHLVAATEYRDRGVKSANFGVLNPAHHLATTAGCLAEVSFLTDPAEEARLDDDGYQQRLVEAMLLGILEYEAKRSREVLPAVLDEAPEFEDGFAVNRDLG